MSCLLFLPCISLYRRRMLFNFLYNRVISVIHLTHNFIVVLATLVILNIISYQKGYFEFSIPMTWTLTYSIILISNILVNVIFKTSVYLVLGNILFSVIDCLFILFALNNIILYYTFHDRLMILYFITTIVTNTLLLKSMGIFTTIAILLNPLCIDNMELFSKIDTSSIFNQNNIIQGFPISIITENINKEECSICCQDYVNKDHIRTLPCTHKYHVNCIDIWLAINM